MKKLKLLLLSLVTMFSTSVLVPATALAVDLSGDSEAAVCEGLALTGGGCDGTADTRIPDIIRTAIRIFQMVVGVIAVFMVITAGVNYVTSAGDSSKTATAKNRILYSAVGLVVVVLSEAIVQFVLNRVG
jgi:uncharacterized membrane protein YidH (DUF202 family)